MLLILLKAEIGRLRPGTVAPFAIQFGMWKKMWFQFRMFTSALYRCCHLYNYPKAPIHSEKHWKLSTARLVATKAVPDGHRVQRMIQFSASRQKLSRLKTLYKLSSILIFFWVVKSIYAAFCLYSSPPRWWYFILLLFFWKNFTFVPPGMSCHASTMFLRCILCCSFCSGATWVKLPDIRCYRKIICLYIGWRIRTYSFVALVFLTNFIRYFRPLKTLWS